MNALKKEKLELLNSIRDEIIILQQKYQVDNINRKNADILDGINKCSDILLDRIMKENPDDFTIYES